MRQNLSRTLFGIILLITTLSARAQSSGVDISGQDVSLVTKFPFRQYYGGVVVIRATIGDHPDTLQFILDTGSAGISLDTFTCIRLGLKLTPSDRIVRGLGASKQVSFAQDYKLNLPGLTIDSLDFHVNDYELISQVYGLQIDGIIGYSLLTRYVVTVDYDHEEIGIYTEGKVKYPRGGFLLKPSISNIPIVGAPLRNGKRTFDQRYYFDTGAGMCLLLCNQFVHDSTILVKKKNKVIQTEAQGLGGKMSMNITTVQEFKIGPYAFRNVPTYLFDDITNITSYPSLGGMIGNDLLRRFNLILNYDKKEIFLYPNTHYRDHFDYSYTGLILYLVDGRVEVTDVIKASPAEKAGIKKGDIVMSVSNNFSGNLQVYRDLLKNVGSRPTILLMRDKELLIKKMVIRSIL
ncbi:aspartyl protease family protein [Chitinophaga horti]|uniref:Aspartyl protease family protein n=1 Tax=Chitinophaga horti TaxID=2920382 RepID=A0ABY6IZS6_9BACT|nr:aspartyl protease family protein [Chitinophaga horti]UYQ92785.1 aspartyl protease family protein [Chitinophaga horti]